MEKKGTYTLAESNEILFGLKAKLEVELTVEECRKLFPKIKNLVSNTVNTEVEFNLRHTSDETPIDVIIDTLQQMKSEGATHVSTDYEYEYHGDDKDLISFKILGRAYKEETDKAWLGRLASCQAKYIENEVYKKRMEIQAHNMGYETYMNLKERYE